MALISAAEYNTVRSLIAQRVGNFTVWGEHSIPTTTTSSGYGRSFTSDLVVGGNTPGVSDTVTSQQYFDLWKDLQAAHVHQYGTVNATIDPTAFEQNIDTVDFQEITDLTTVASAVLAFDHSTTEFDSSSFQTDTIKASDGVTPITSVRSTAWGGSGNVQSINHQVTIDFGTHNNLLYYLAAGGEIRFEAQITGGTVATPNTKDWDWNETFTEMGTITFGRINNAEWRSQASQGSTIQQVSLASSSPGTLIFEKQGGGETGGTPGDVPVTQIYADNYYRIYAWTNGAFASATQLVFNIIFDDGDTGTGGQAEPGGPTGSPIDENVTGTVTSLVYSYYPDSDFTYNSVVYPAIQQSPPTGTINSNL